jgi:hypothetical protein
MKRSSDLLFAAFDPARSSRAGAARTRQGLASRTKRHSYVMALLKQEAA